MAHPKKKVGPRTAYSQPAFPGRGCNDPNDSGLLALRDIRVVLVLHLRGDGREEWGL